MRLKVSAPRRFCANFRVDRGAHIISVDLDVQFGKVIFSVHFCLNAYASVS